MYPFHVTAIVKTVVHANRDTCHELFIKSYSERQLHQNGRPTFIKTLNGIIITKSNFKCFVQ